MRLLSLRRRCLVVVVVGHPLRLAALGSVAGIEDGRGARGPRVVGKPFAEG